jgi:hypothetical protein
MLFLGTFFGLYLAAAYKITADVYISDYYLTVAGGNIYLTSSYG